MNSLAQLRRNRRRQQVPTVQLKQPAYDPQDPSTLPGASSGGHHTTHTAPTPQPHYTTPNAELGGAQVAASEAAASPHLHGQTPAQAAQSAAAAYGPSGVDAQQTLPPVVDLTRALAQSIANGTSPATALATLTAPAVAAGDKLSTAAAQQALAQRYAQALWQKSGASGELPKIEITPVDLAKAAPKSNGAGILTKHGKAPPRVVISQQTLKALALKNGADFGKAVGAIGGALKAAQAARADQRREDLRAVLSQLTPEQQKLAKPVIKASRKTGVPASLLMAVAGQESGFGTNTGPSSAGARGDFQFISSTRDSMIAKYGVDPWSPNLDEQALAAALLLKEQGVLQDPQSALSSYSGGYAAADYNNPILESAKNFTPLDKFASGTGGSGTGAPSQPQTPSVQFRGQTVKLGGPYSGSRALVRLITGSPHLRGDHGGTPFGEAPGIHAPDGDHYRPDGYAQDINGDNPRENEPPFSQSTMDTIVRNLRALGAHDSAGNPVPDLQIGEGGTYEVQGYTVYVEPVSNHIHVGAHPDGPAPGSVDVSGAGIAAAPSGGTTAPSTGGAAASTGAVQDLAAASAQGAADARAGGQKPPAPFISTTPLTNPTPTLVPFAGQGQQTDPYAQDRYATIQAIMDRIGIGGGSDVTAFLRSRSG